MPGLFKKFKPPCIILVFLFFGCSDDPAHFSNNRFPLAEQHNIDRKQLDLAFQNAAEIDDLQGLAVARNSVIVAEEYFTLSGAGPDSSLDVRSVTKSFTSTLIGIAIDKGYIRNVDQKLNEFLGPEVDQANPQLGQVTLRDLLTMTCGHAWQEIDEPSEFPSFATANDQLTYIFRKPIIHTPGTVFDYSDGAAHLVSAALTSVVDMSAAEFANKYLFNPMGITDRFWYDDNRRISYGGVGLCIGIHDMIKFGYLIINKGEYKGKRIVSEKWIDKATAFSISTGNLLPHLTEYGYFWWRGKNYNHEYVCAMGYGGQFILISRELNLVIASRCNWRGINSSLAGQNWWSILDILINQILPAVKQI